MIPGVVRKRVKVDIVPSRTRSQPCRWCGRAIVNNAAGRRRLYCRQSCRQRAYEQRAALSSTAGPLLAPDAVVLSAGAAADLSDRFYQVRCAAEDVVTALDEGADRAELRELCDALMRAVRAADGWR
jgi:hypothetical protein